MLATSAPANGLFRGDPFDVGIAGGFSSPFATRFLAESDVIVAFGAALNQWTTRHGTLVGPRTRVVQVDEKEVRVDIMHEIVRQALLMRDDKSVFIRADGAASVQAFMTVTDKLKEAGVEKVGLMAKPVEKR